MKPGLRYILILPLCFILCWFVYPLIKTQPSEKVLSAQDSVTTPSSNFSILFGGDFMLGRSVNSKIIKNKDYSWPVQKISGFTQTADLFVVNLEAPFSESCPQTDEGMIFCSPKENISSLKESGVDVVNLANNHIGNYGQKGIQFTQDLLNENSISYTGTNNVSYSNIGNTKIALIGFNDIGDSPKGVTSTHDDNLEKLILEGKTNADIVIALFHWGNEYQNKPSTRQIELAHQSIDFGADAVVGHHPHWVQSQEEYQEKPIYYSLGNLVFDQMWSEETQKGILVRLTFENKSLVSQEVIPLLIKNFGQPDFN